MKKEVNYFIKGLVISSTLFVASCSGESETGEAEGNDVDLSVSTYLSSSHGQVEDVLEPYFEEIEEKTDGRVTADYYTSNALGAAEDQFDMAVTGVADFSLS